MKKWDLPGWLKERGGEATGAKGANGAADDARDGAHRQKAALFQHEQRPSDVAGMSNAGDPCRVCPRPREVIADLQGNHERVDEGLRGRREGKLLPEG